MSESNILINCPPSSGKPANNNISVDPDYRLTLVQFLYVEILGALIPGIVAVGATWAIVFHAARFYKLVDDSFIKTIVEHGFRPYGAAFLVIISYVVGAIVYRRPHDAPDAASCYRVWNKAMNAGVASNTLSFCSVDCRPMLIKLMHFIVRRFRCGLSAECVSTDNAVSCHKCLDRLLKYMRRTWTLHRGIVLWRCPFHVCYQLVLKILWLIAWPVRGTIHLWDHLFAPERILYWERMRTKSSSFHSDDIRRSSVIYSYPYPYLRKYLISRNAEKLADFVPWCENGNVGHRNEDGKLFINRIKQRIRDTNHPELIRDMVRNEGHVRILSSVWFVLRFLLRAIIAINIVFAAYAVSTHVNDVQARTFFHKVCRTKNTSITDNSSNRLKKLILRVAFKEKEVQPVSNQPVPQSDFSREGVLQHIILTILMLAVMLYLKYIIEDGFHYVRLRELNMVLETASILQGGKTKDDETGLFSDYLKRSSECCPESKCNDCRAVDGVQSSNCLCQ